MTCVSINVNDYQAPWNINQASNPGFYMMPNCSLPSWRKRSIRQWVQQTQTNTSFQMSHLGSETMWGSLLMGTRQWRGTPEVYQGYMTWCREASWVLFQRKGLSCRGVNGLTISHFQHNPQCFSLPSMPSVPVEAFYLSVIKHFCGFC